MLGKLRHFFIFFHINFLLDYIEQIFVIDLIVRKYSLDETFISITNCMQKNMILSLCCSYFLSNNKVSIGRNKVFWTLFIKRKSFNVKIMANKCLWKHRNVFELNKYTVTLCSLSLATVDKIRIIYSISNVEAINFDLDITIVNIYSKIDIWHNLILYTAKGAQKNDHKYIEYFGDHASLPRVGEK